MYPSARLPSLSLGVMALCITLAAEMTGALAPRGFTNNLDLASGVVVLLILSLVPFSFGESR